MAQKFHINDSGVAGPCKATKKACRFGEENHYDNGKDAIAAAERKLQSETNSSNFGTVKKPKAKSHMDFESRNIRFPKNVDSESIERTSTDITRFYSNESNHSKKIRIEDRTGYAVGINMITYDKHSGEYSYGRLKSGTFITFTKGKDLKSIVTEAANEHSFDDDEKLHISWDD